MCTDVCNEGVWRPGEAGGGGGGVLEGVMSTVACTACVSVSQLQGILVTSVARLRLACTASTVPGTLRAGDHNLAAALSGRPPSPRTTCRTDPAASQRYQVVTRVAELFNFDINSVLQIQYSKNVKSAFTFEELSDTITNRHLTSCLHL